MNNISPLRYPGGKSKACKIIDEIISKEFDSFVFFNWSSKLDRASLVFL